MLRLGARQKAAFAALTRENFAARACAHLRRFFPEICDRLGDDGLTRRIEDGVARARAHLIVDERGVVLFLDLMFSLGDGFDDDPTLPWVRELLSRPGVPGPTRARDLFLVALAHAEQQRGSRC